MEWLANEGKPTEAEQGPIWLGRKWVISDGAWGGLSDLWRLITISG